MSVSYIGYQPQDYAYKGQGSVIIILKEDLQNLDEVVVVGYGVAKKRDLTGSVASVKGEKLQETASFTAAQSLQGRAAGVTILSTSAKPDNEYRYVRVVTALQKRQPTRYMPRTVLLSWWH